MRKPLPISPVILSYVALDLSPAQLACLELRVSAYRNLAHEELLELIGSRASDRRAALYARCREGLSPAALRFWDARPEQVILFRISAWDTNCPQHIPQKFDATDVAAALAARDARIAELEAELAAMRGEASSSGRAI